MKKVAIIGTTQSAIVAPYKNSEWEIWGTGARAECVTRATRWFELHRLDGEEHDWAANWRKLVKSWPKDCELWMFYPEEDLSPGKVVHMESKPLLNKYGTFFMTSSIAWMLAQAIEEKAEQILLSGIDMESEVEYKHQLAGVRHFIELARYAGIKVLRVANSGISIEPIPYPFWQDDPIISKLALRKKVYQNRLLTANQKKEELKNAIKLIEGALSEVEWLEDYLQP